MRALTLFLYEAVMHPSMVGALFPSSKRLAYSLAQQISTNPPGLVIELGAGTGAITAALVDFKNPLRLIAKNFSTSFFILSVLSGHEVTDILCQFLI